MVAYNDKIFESLTLISDVINRVLNNTACTELYVWKEKNVELKDVYPNVKIIQHKELHQLIGKTVYCRVDDIKEISFVEQLVRNNKKNKNIVIYVPDVKLVNLFDNGIGIRVYLSEFSSFKGYLFLCGELFCPSIPMKVPDDFRVLAIIHFYNEEDILAKTIEYLLNQNVDIYLLDNWSTDVSYNIANQYRTQYPKRVFLERFPDFGRNDSFELYKQLERTEILAKQMNYDWFIHYDADEIRVSFWENVSLRDTIYRVDQLGYNCIENTVIDFKITSNDNQNIFMKDTYFDFGHRKAHFKQVKTWKRTETIELKRSGGHIANVENPSIFPLKMLNRHYPLRSLEQSRKKIFYERKPRFTKERGERGWHGQYDKYKKNSDLIEKKENLLLWTHQTFKVLYIPIVMGCGIKIEKDEIKLCNRLQSVKNKKVIIYGAGEWGKEICLNLMIKNEIVKWVDMNHVRLPMTFCIMIESPDEIKSAYYDYLIIALKEEKQRKEIKHKLITKYNICEEKII